eukprot:643549-Amphidinium_carterae.1
MKNNDNSSVLRLLSDSRTRVGPCCRPSQGSRLSRPNSFNNFNAQCAVAARIESTAVDRSRGNH